MSFNFQNWNDRTLCDKLQWFSLVCKETKGKFAITWGLSDKMTKIAGAAETQMELCSIHNEW